MARSNLDLRGADNPRKVFGRWADYDYSAFISYAKADIKHAADIERRLNRFLAQPNLEGKWTPFGPVPRRLRSAFRDRSVLQAHHDIDAALKEKLDQSASLIVVCSPDAVTSTFVDEEIKHFIRQHGRERVFTYIVDGEPGSPDRECFPEALRFELDFDADPEGVVLNGADERDEVHITPPLGGDIRPSPDGDGPEMAFDKLLAGLLGVELSDVSRSARRQEFFARWGNYISAAAISLFPIVFLLSWALYSQFLSTQKTASLFLADKAKEYLVDGYADRALLTALEASGISDTALPQRDSLWARLIAAVAAKENQLEASFLGSDRRQVAISQNGKRFVEVSAVDLRVWDFDASGSWENSATLFGNDRQPRKIVLSDEEQKSDYISALLSNQAEAVALSPNGNVIYASYNDRNVIWTHQTQGVWVRQKLGKQNKAVSFHAKFSPDSRSLITLFPFQDAEVWQLKSDGSWEQNGLVADNDFLFYAGFSHDGKQLVTASTNKIVKIWHQKDGIKWTVKSEITLDHPIMSIGMSPTENLLVAALENGTSVVATETTSNDWKIDALTGHEAPATTVQFSHNGNQFATGAQDGSVRVWEKGTDNKWNSIELEGHSDAINDVHFSSDGRQLVTASSDNSVGLWTNTSERGWELYTLNGHKSTPHSVQISEDGTRLFSISNIDFRIWKQTQELDRIEHGQGAINDARFGPDENVVVTAGGDGSARIWTKERNGHWSEEMLVDSRSKTTTIDLSEDGKTVITGSTNGELSSWRRDENGTWQNELVGTHSSAIRRAEISPDQHTILTTANKGPARLWFRKDSEGWDFFEFVGGNAEVHAAAFTYDGKYIATGDTEGYIRVWQSGENKEWKLLYGDFVYASITSLKFSRGNYFGGHILLAGTSGGRVYEYILSTGILGRVFESGFGYTNDYKGHSDEEITALGFLQDEGAFYSISKDGTGTLWVEDPGGYLDLTFSDEAKILSMASDKSGTHFITTTDDGVAHIWSLDTSRKFLRETVCTSLPKNRHLLDLSELAEQRLPDSYFGPCERPGLLSRDFWRNRWADYFGTGDEPIQP